jgi:hypothetical protein
VIDVIFYAFNHINHSNHFRITVQTIVVVQTIFARTITYKKMTIIYNIVDDIVLVRRVVAGSLIK